MEPLSVRYRDVIMEMLKKSRGQMQVTDENVLQHGNADILPFIDRILEENLLPGSEIRGFERLAELAEAAARGESCLLLMEHYSNFDLPIFHYLLRKRGPEGARVADRLVAIAGVKLNESHPIVLAFAEAYTRIVIVPSRALQSIKEHPSQAAEAVAEMMKGMSINRAAMKVLAEEKKAGRIVLVFPSGTRYRPWDPTSKKGVREIDSYVKNFDHMMLVSINGNIFRISEKGEMQEDLLVRDRVVYQASAMIDPSEFRGKVKEAVHFGHDRKQAIVDEIMKGLDELHAEVEKTLS